MSGADDLPLFDRADRAASVIRSMLANVPKVAVVLGSGLGHLADLVTRPTVIPYASIPEFPTPTVEGHEGKGDQHTHGHASCERGKAVRCRIVATSRSPYGRAGAAVLDDHR